MPPAARVTFLPSGATVSVESGKTVLEAAREAGIAIAAVCAGRGVCGQCAVRVIEGVLQEPDDAELLGLRRAPAGIRLGCRARVLGDVSVEPLASLGARGAGSGIGGKRALGVDLGTTTVGVLAVALDDGREIGRAEAPNLQQSFGADVLSRISATAHSARELQRLAVESVLEAVAASGVQPPFERVVIAGNTAMVALLAGVPVEQLGTYPFTAPEVPLALARDHPLVGPLGDPTIDIVHPLNGFIGGDLTAGLLAAGPLGSEDTSLYVDIGTNAEVALVAFGRLWVASAAAGPAFEGSGVSHGGPPIEGAIVRVQLDGDSVRVTTIQDEPPVWFTGAGLVSMLAELRRASVVDVDGALDRSHGLVCADDAGVAYVSPGGAPAVRLTQLDIRALQLAKAAVQTAVDAVMREAGVAASGISSVLIAGAFGGAVDPADLVEIGIIPAETLSRARTIGNASLEGAAALALAPESVERLMTATFEARRVNLATSQGYQQDLLAALVLGRR